MSRMPLVSRVAVVPRVAVMTVETLLVTMVGSVGHVVVRAVVF
ncbi:hypothetical protein [Microbacterium sp. UBA3394]|nr:hypothetical protein [Microbacterium sp. UBA3394]